MTQEFRELLRRHGLGDRDCLMAKNVVDVSCESLERLRADEWLDMWVIAAAMQLVEQSSSIRIGLSVPLHEKDNRGKAVSKSRPLAAWRGKIDDFREIRRGRNGNLIYLCPLNVGGDHFTLLEINEEMKMIYHFDSLTSPSVVRGRSRGTSVRKVVEVGFVRSPLIFHVWTALMVYS
jgi:hypothetical protein